ncbi:MAG TPA: hypothetical protein VFX16_04475 [Pseudonocardiaceae bacterium]|nr:hypothetical protein [Pseudonocardiaceae bacterium]
MPVLSTIAGERFANAVAAQDPAALRAVLADHVDFAALTPGGHWTATGPAEVDDIVLGHWFAPDRRIVELSSVTTAEVADCQHVGYRLLVQRDGADHVVEQQAFYTVLDGGIDWIRIVCSGYRPTA